MLFTETRDISKNKQVLIDLLLCPEGYSQRREQGTLPTLLKERLQQQIVQFQNHQIPVINIHKVLTLFEANVANPLNSNLYCDGSSPSTLRHLHVQPNVSPSLSRPSPTPRNHIPSPAAPIQRHDPHHQLPSPSPLHHSGHHFQSPSALAAEFPSPSPSRPSPAPASTAPTSGPQPPPLPRVPSFERPSSSPLPSTRPRKLTQSASLPPNKRQRQSTPLSRTLASETNMPTPRSTSASACDINADTESPPTTSEYPFVELIHNDAIVDLNMNVFHELEQTQHWVSMALVWEDGLTSLDLCENQKVPLTKRVKQPPSMALLCVLSKNLDRSKPGKCRILRFKFEGGPISSATAAPGGRLGMEAMMESSSTSHRMNCFSRLLCSRYISKIIFDWKHFLKYLLQVPSLRNHLLKALPFPGIRDAQIAAWMLNPDLSKEDLAFSALLMSYCRSTNPHWDIDASLFNSLQKCNQKLLQNLEKSMKLWIRVSKAVKETGLGAVLAKQEMPLSSILARMEVWASAIIMIRFVFSLAISLKRDLLDHSG